MTGNIGLIVTGLVAVLVGFLMISIFAGPVIDNFATSGANTNLPSFSGGRAVNDLFVILYYLASLILILGGAGVGILGGARAVRGKKRK